jgi:hypothetical protein
VLHDGIVRADEISWAPSWIDEPPIDQTDLFSMDAAELFRYADNLRCEYRALRAFWAVAVARIAEMNEELSRARRVIGYQREQLRAAGKMPFLHSTSSTVSMASTDVETSA